MDCDPQGAAHILQRLIGACGGFLGGTSLIALSKPNGLGDAFGRIVVSTASATMLGGFVTEKLGMPGDDSEALMGVSFGIGFLAWNLLGSISLYFSKREGKDVKELLEEAKK